METKRENHILATSFESFDWMCWFHSAAGKAHKACKAFSFSALCRFREFKWKARCETNLNLRMTVDNLLSIWYLLIKSARHAHFQLED